MRIKAILGAAFLATGMAGLSTAAQSAQTLKQVVNPGTLKLGTAKPALKLAPLHLACKAWGSPADFPTGILLTNDSARTVPAGTHIHWVMNANHKKQGDYTFGSALNHGKSVAAPGVRGGWGRNAPCTVSFVNPPATPAKPKTARMKPALNLAKLHLACKAWGSPEEFPTGILLTNDGKRAVPKGTHIHWVMDGNAAKKGDYTLTAMLARGKSVSAPGVPGGWGRGAPCTVSIK